eukprot:3940916-Rhodomonas_salina.3
MSFHHYSGYVHTVKRASPRWSYLLLCTYAMTRDIIDSRQVRIRIREANASGRWRAPYPGRNCYLAIGITMTSMSNDGHAHIA